MRVAVIGAGLAGASVAYALAKRGVEVAVFEKGSSPASGSSGNPFGLFVPYIGQEETPASQLYTEGFDFLQKLLDHLSPPLVRRHGALQLPSTPRINGLISRLEGLDRCEASQWIPREETERMTGVPCNSSGVWYRQAGSLSPKHLVAALLAIPLITIRLSTEVVRLVRDQGLWVLYEEGEEVHRADVVVVANAYECQKIQQTAWLPAEQVRGQIIQIATTPLLQKLSSALCFDGYILPHHEGTHLVGASYDHHFMGSEVCATRSHDLIRRLCARVPSLDPNELSIVDGRVSYRTSTHDRLPYVGSVPTEESARAAIEGRGDSPEYHPSLYVSSGHGSRGLLSAPLAGELLAQEILESSSCLSANLLRPWRATYRLRKRREKKLEEERRLRRAL